MNDKRVQHLTSYDSFNTEVAVTNVCKHKAENITNAYSILNHLEFDLIDNDHKNITLKNAVSEKMRLRVFEYSMGKHIYMLTYERLNLKHKTCGTAKKKKKIDLIRRNEIRIKKKNN